MDGNLVRLWMQCGGYFWGALNGIARKVTGEDGMHNSGSFVCCQFTLEVSTVTIQDGTNETTAN